MQSYVGHELHIYIYIYIYINVLWRWKQEPTTLFCESVGGALVVVAVVSINKIIIKGCPLFLMPKNIMENYVKADYATT